MLSREESDGVVVVYFWQITYLPYPVPTSLPQQMWICAGAPVAADASCRHPMTASVAEASPLTISGSALF